MAERFGRIGIWWKAAAGCAICASLVAGVIEDVRHWITDRTLGRFWPDVATFEGCLGLREADLARPEGASFYVIVARPLGDSGAAKAQLVERSLRRAYGETDEAPVRVGLLDCVAPLPEGGQTDARFAKAQDRAQALIATTGADVVIWGEVLNDGRQIELRFARADGPDRAADFDAERVTLDAAFLDQMGNLVAARALASVTAVVQGFDPDRVARLDEAAALTAPLIETPLTGLSPGMFGEILLAHGVARSGSAGARAELTALEPVRDLLERARAALDPATQGASYALAVRTLATTAVLQTGLLSPNEARRRIEAALADLTALVEAPPPGLSPDDARRNRLMLARTSLALAAQVPLPEAEPLAAKALDLVTQTLLQADPAAFDQWLDAQLDFAEIATEYAKGLRGLVGLNVLKRAEEVVTTARSALPEDTPDLRRMSLAVALQEILSVRAQGHYGEARLAEATRALEVAAEVTALLSRADFPGYWASHERSVGVLHLARAEAVAGPSAAQDLEAAAHRIAAAAEVMTRETAPLAWADIQIDLAYVANLCARNDVCGPRAESQARERDYLQAAREVFVAQDDKAGLAFVDDLLARSGTALPAP